MTPSATGWSATSAPGASGRPAIWLSSSHRTRRTGTRPTQSRSRRSGRSRATRRSNGTVRMRRSR
jgi:hypothetical protein